MASLLEGLRETGDSEEEEEEEEDYPQNPQILPPAFAPGETNSQLTVGYKGDRSYVVRGNNIGVFNHTGDGDVKYYATIGNISTPKGKSFKPKEVGGSLELQDLPYVRVR